MQRLVDLVFADIARFFFAFRHQQKFISFPLICYETFSSFHTFVKRSKKSNEVIADVFNPKQ